MKTIRSLEDLPKLKISEFKNTDDMKKDNLMESVSKKPVIKSYNDIKSGNKIEKSKAMTIESIRKEIDNYHDNVDTDYRFTPRSRYINGNHYNYNPGLNRNIPTKKNGGYTQSVKNIESGKSLTLFGKILISAVILALAFISKNINTPVTNFISGGIKTAVTNKFDIDKSLGKLKFVTNYLPDIKAAFLPDQSGKQTKTNTPAKSISLIAPVEGRVIHKFGNYVDSNNKTVSCNGIEIEGSANSPVYATADGQVTAVGNNSQYGCYVEISHNNGYKTIYANCTKAAVTLNQKVKQKDVIANVEKTQNSKLFHFILMYNGNPIDPLQYISEKNKLIKQGGTT